MCCFTTHVSELPKPSWTICPHCTGFGCGIYPTRPASCRAFECGWYRDPAAPDDLRPDRCGVMIEVLDGTHVVMAVVDPQRPSAWKSDIVTPWLRRLVDAGHPVIVRAGPEPPPCFLIRDTQDISAVEATMKWLDTLAKKAAEPGVCQSLLHGGVA